MSKAPILALDTEQYKSTLVYTLYNKRAGVSFTLDTVQQVEDFTAAWYKCPIKTRYAYDMLHHIVRPLYVDEPLPASLAQMITGIWDDSAA